MENVSTYKTKSMQEMIQDQIRLKKDYINQHSGDRSQCKKTADVLEQVMRTTMSNSKSDEKYFYLPFQKGCGKEVRDMLSSHQLDSFVSPLETIDTSDKLFVSFQL